MSVIKTTPKQPRTRRDFLIEIDKWEKKFVRYETKQESKYSTLKQENDRLKMDIKSLKKLKVPEIMDKRDYLIENESLQARIGAQQRELGEVTAHKEQAESDVRALRDQKDKKWLEGNITIRLMPFLEEVRAFANQNNTTRIKLLELEKIVYRWEDIV